VHSARFQIETLRHGTASVARHMATLTERAQLRMRHVTRWSGLRLPARWRKVAAF
jgi:hypothetical protein